jgi:hypothetical protein
MLVQHRGWELAVAFLDDFEPRYTLAQQLVL